MPAASDTSRPAFIAADVGGTHARVALVRSDGAGGVDVLRYARYRCADAPGLDTIVARFLAEAADDAASDSAGQTAMGSPKHARADAPVGTRAATPANVPPNALATHAVLACAGMLHGDELINTNLPWSVSLAALRDRLGLARVDLINDFEALAHAVPTVSAAGSRRLIGPERPGRPVDGGTVVVMGPGTGLGCAAVLPDAGGRHRVLATEAGHIALAAGTRREAAVVAWLAGAQTHVPVERVVSGPGLANIDAALAAIDGLPANVRSPSDVTSAALAGSDRIAVEAVQLFCGWLGSFSADVALLYGATGGVLLAGGFLPALDAALRDGVFESRFLAKGVLAPWLRQVPVRLLDHGQLAVVGAARWSLSRDAC